MLHYKIGFPHFKENYFVLYGCFLFVPTDPIAILDDNFSNQTPVLNINNEGINVCVINICMVSGIQSQKVVIPVTGHQVTVCWLCDNHDQEF